MNARSLSLSHTKIQTMSPRPKRCRRMGIPPKLRGYKPLGVACKESLEVSILFEEYEAFRLAAYENLPQEEAATRMNVSRPTFTRIYNKAITKIAQAFVEGRTIVFEGGDVEFDKNWYRCHNCNTVFHSATSSNISCTNCKSNDLENINESLESWKGAGRGIKKKICVCSHCGKQKQGRPGVPCRDEECPDCHKPMTREE